MVVESLEIPVSVDTKQAKAQLGKFEDDVQGFQRRIKSQTAIEASVKLAKLREGLSTLQKELKKARVTGNKNAVITIRAKTELLKKDITQANRELNNFIRTGNKTKSVLGGLFEQASPKNLISGLKQGAAQMIGFAGAAGAAGLAIHKLAEFLKLSADTAISFESAFAGVIKTIDGLSDEFGNLNDAGEGLKQSLIDLSTEIPVTFEGLAGIAEIGGQLGVGKDSIIEFTSVIAKLGSATNLTEESVGTAFAQLQTVLKFTADEFENLGSSLVALGNNSATTEQSIVDFSKRLLTAATITGLTADQVLAIGAAVTSAGINVEAGGTAIQKAFLTINDAISLGSDELELFAAVSGSTVEEFKKKFDEDASGAFTDFIEGLGKQGKEGSLILETLGLGSERTKAALLTLAGSGEVLREKILLSNKAFVENNALQEEAQKRYNTTEEKLKSLNNELAAQRNILGSELKGVSTEFLSFQVKTLKITNSLVERFNGLNKRLEGFKLAAKSVIPFADLMVDALVSVGSALGLVDEQARRTLKTLSLISKTRSASVKVFVDQENIPPPPDFSDLINKLSKKEEGSVGRSSTKITDIRKKALEQQLADQIAFINASDASDKEKARRIINAQKVINSQIEDLTKDGIDAQTDAAESLIEKYEELKDSGKDAFETTTDGIEDSLEKITDFDDKIGDINGKIDELANKTTVSLADRFVDAGEEVADLGLKLEDLADKRSELEAQSIENVSTGADDTSTQESLLDTLAKIAEVESEINRLEQERAFASENIGATEEERLAAIQDAESRASETESERIVRIASEKQAALEQEILAVKSQKDQELEILGQFFLQAQDQATTFAATFDESLRVPEERLKNLVALASQIQATSGITIGSQLRGTEAGQSIVNNRSVNITNNNTVPDATTAEAIARATGIQAAQN